MSLTKISTAYKDIISALENQPTQTATQLKAKFDEAPDAIIDYLNNTLTAEQDAINSTITNLTPNVVAITDAEGNITVSTITNEQLLYLNGISANIQTQIDGKQNVITYGTSQPSGGADGDIYIQYE